jgi:hypothetical protein
VPGVLRAEVRTLEEDLPDAEGDGELELARAWNED